MMTPAYSMRDFTRQPLCLLRRRLLRAKRGVSVTMMWQSENEREPTIDFVMSVAKSSHRNSGDRQRRYDLVESAQGPNVGGTMSTDGGGRRSCDEAYGRNYVLH